MAREDLLTAIIHNHWTELGNFYYKRTGTELHRVSIFSDTSILLEGEDDLYSTGLALGNFGRPYSDSTALVGVQEELKANWTGTLPRFSYRLRILKPSAHDLAQAYCVINEKLLY